MAGHHLVAGTVPPAVESRATTDGALSGMILAEVELEHEAQTIELPDWLGREVTGDLRFGQSMMLRLSGELGRNLTLVEVLAAPL